VRAITSIVGIVLAVTLLAAPDARADRSSADRVEPAGATVAYKNWGRVRAPDQKLRKGCRLYKFRYRVAPPAGDHWMAEIFLRRPDGVALGYKTYLTDKPDPVSAKRRFKVCRNSTTFGRHKLSMKVTWYDSKNEPHSGWVRPAYFRLKRR